ncbi:hypothetical protein LEP1GSC126_1725 [Leptospira kirschneri str. 200801774]|nr:hypothetical protein LEP1GSC126_1725 [Leptospira kirschneri str. 200801774]
MKLFSFLRKFWSNLLSNTDQNILELLFPNRKGGLTQNIIY